MTDLTPEKRAELRRLAEAARRAIVAAADYCGEHAARQLEGDNDTLRAEVNRLNAEAGELKRQLEEAEDRVRIMGAMVDERNVSIGVLQDLLRQRDAAIDAVAEMDRVYREPGTDANDVIEAYQYRVMPAMRALSVLDQPSEPKT